MERPDATGPAEIEAILDLSPQQQGMLFESLRCEGGELFIEQEIHAVPGTLDLDRLVEAWTRMLARHAGLRTAFVWRNRAEPLQVVFAKVEPRIRFEDWGGLPPHVQKRKLDEFIAADRAEGFDLSAAPLLRIAVIRMSDGVSQLVLTQHHILLDGWSRAILLEELNDAYAGVAPAEPPPPPYAHYIEWLKHQDAAAAEQFWRDMLRGFVRPTALGKPSRLAIAASRERFGEVDTVISAADAERIDAAMRQHRVTLAAALHGAWALLLSRYSGGRDVVFGSTASGRPPDLPGVERTFGLFINTIAFRIDVDPAANVWSWLAQVHQRLLDVRTFEFVSAGQIHRWSDVPASTPLYESILVFENYPLRKGQESDKHHGRHIGARTPYPLTLLVGAHEGWAIRAVHDTRRLTRFNVARLLEQLRMVLRQLGSFGDGPVADLLRLIPSYAIPEVQPPSSNGHQRLHVPPASPLEKKLAALATEVLGLATIGMSDRFFDLGAHSLLATQFLSRVRRAFQVDVPMRVLFDSPDMRALAAVIEEAVLAKINNLTENEARMLMEQMD